MRMVSLIPRLFPTCSRAHAARAATASALLVALAVASAAQAQPRATGSANAACAMLTRDLVLQATTASALQGKTPHEVRLAATGSACEWGDVMLVIDQYTPTELEQVLKTSRQTWKPVAGVGDATYTHNLKDMMAEVMGRVGKHTFAVEVTIPTADGVAVAEAGALKIAKAVATRLR